MAMTTTESQGANPQSIVPVLLLKTKSSPKDNYDEYFASLSSHAAAASSATVGVTSHGGADDDDRGDSSSLTHTHEPSADAQMRGQQHEYERKYRCTFVPVFEHSFRTKELSDIKKLILTGAFRRKSSFPSSHPHLSGGDTSSHTGEQRYGGLIFTSQRAVEPFARLINELRASYVAAAATSFSSLDELLPPESKIYTVGPATTRALKAIGLACPVLGDHTGNGEKLAEFILEDYHAFPSTNSPNNNDDEYHARPPLLFIIGEQHRDVIPRMLQSTEVPDSRRITVDEMVVYETKVMESFATDFAVAIDDAVAAAAASSSSLSSLTSLTSTYSLATGMGPDSAVDQGQSWMWIIVFSPNGCKAMLETLGLLDRDKSSSSPSTTGDPSTALKKVYLSSSPIESISTSIAGARHLALSSQQEQEKEARRRPKVYPFIATIGPTTRDYLRREFGIDPHVCAAKPSPEGIAEGILSFERAWLTGIKQ